MKKSLFLVVSCSILLSIGLAQENGDSLRLTRQLGLQGRVIWVDGTANLHWLIDRQQVRDFLQKVKAANLNTIVLDVKPISGHVLYNSQIAPTLKAWKNATVPEGLDVLQMFLEEAHAIGLPVHVSINILSEGHKLNHTGPAYERPEWQMVAYTGQRTLMLPNGDRFDLNRFDSPPPPNGIAAYLRSPAPPPPPNTERAYALLSDDLRVLGVVSGQFVSEPISPPDGGWVLLADGRAAVQFEKLAALGVTFRLEVMPQFQRIADSDTEGVAVFVNPLNPDVRLRILAIVREIIENYPVDGLVLDRMRWANVYTDFSEFSRAAFESRYGRVDSFPQDILTIPQLPRQPVTFGRRFGQWVQFRAEVIRDLLKAIRQEIESVRPLPVGVYVGSWYSTYYEYGVNWASDEIERPYGFADPSYRFSSYLGLVDYLMPGCYYPVAFVNDAALYDTDEMRTVEGSAKKSVEWAADDTFVYAGIYAQDYNNNPVEFERSIRAAINNTHGVMIFDSSQIVAWNWWEPIRRALTNTVPPAPHEYPSLLKSLRIR